VEGANLFVTTNAHKVLYAAGGIVIVKDSSANKGGVITSLYVICAAMLLSGQEFVEHKPHIVTEVLEKLRGLAKLEAELLFREGQNNGGLLPEISQVISNCINAATDALALALYSLSEADREALLPLFRSHLPKTIADLVFDWVHERVPPQYIKNAIASTLAAKMVYKEGTKFIESLPQHKLASIAQRNNKWTTSTYTNNRASKRIIISDGQTYFVSLHQGLLLPEPTSFSLPQRWIRSQTLVKG